MTGLKTINHLGTRGALGRFDFQIELIMADGLDGNLCDAKNHEVPHLGSLRSIGAAR